jgi:hypothetical protein
MRTLGPIVVDPDTFFTYFPFAEAGRERMSSSITAAKLASNAVSSKLALSSGTCTLP